MLFTSFLRSSLLKSVDFVRNPDTSAFVTFSGGDILRVRGESERERKRERKRKVTGLGFM
jgi:hypothetical protein